LEEEILHLEVLHKETMEVMTALSSLAVAVVVLEHLRQFTLPEEQTVPQEQIHQSQEH
jgi:hypothetical protein